MVLPQKSKLILLSVVATVALFSIPTVHAVSENASSKAQERLEKVEIKRQELSDKLEAIKEQRSEKLSENRLKVCENRQATINKIIANSATQSEKHLAVFQKIEDRVVTFYEEKTLSLDTYDTLLATVDEKEAAAIAAIDLAKETTFSCDDADATNPGSLARELVKSEHTALKEYRTAIKDLLVAIKTTAAQSTDAAESEE